MDDQIRRTSDLAIPKAPGIHPNPALHRFHADRSSRLLKDRQTNHLVNHQATRTNYRLMRCRIHRVDHGLARGEGFHRERCWRDLHLVG